LFGDHHHHNNNNHHNNNHNNNHHNNNHHNNNHHNNNHHNNNHNNNNHNNNTTADEDDAYDAYDLLEPERFAVRWSSTYLTRTTSNNTLTSKTLVNTPPRSLCSQVPFKTLDQIKDFTGFVNISAPQMFVAFDR
jgi:cobalamin biosynthesis protein CobT